MQYTCNSLDVKGQMSWSGSCSVHSAQLKVSSYVKRVYPKVSERVLDFLMNDCALFFPLQPRLSQVSEQTVQTALYQANRHQLIKTYSI